MATVPKISLLKFKPTGHTLAVLSRTADAAGVIDAKAVAPNGFRIVSTATQASATPPLAVRTLRVPVDYLEVSSVDLTRELVLEPTADAGVSAVSPIAPPAASVASNHQNLSVIVSPANPTGNPIDFWVLLEAVNPPDPANPARRMAKGSIPGGGTNSGAMIMQSVPPSGQGGSPMPIDVGRYHAVAFVTGYGFLMQEINVA